MKGKLYIIFFIFLLSCSLFEVEERQQGSPVARVYDKYLYPSDLFGIVDDKMPKQDSINIVTNYIDNWVRQNLILHLVEQNLPEDQKRLNRQIEDYRNALLIFAYEQKLIEQKLDTIIDNNEVKVYYSNHKENFRLSLNIIQMSYVKLDNKSEEIRLFRKLLKSDETADKRKLFDLCSSSADVKKYSLDTSWYFLNHILEEISLKTYNKENFLRFNKYIEKADTSSIYFLRIKNYGLSNEVAPLSYVRNDIIQILLNKRKVKLLDQIKRNIYQNALKKGDYEVYY